jgi:hypothetical protein
MHNLVTTLGIVTKRLYLQDYPTAIDYHLRHLKIAQELYDKVN